MTDADLRSKLAECENVIQQLVTKLQETVDENDRLRALVAKLTGTDDAHSTPLELVANDPDSNLPLAELVHRRRRRQNALQGLALDDPRWGEWRDDNGSGKGGNGSDHS
jgi:hypothetical protein